MLEHKGYAQGTIVSFKLVNGDEIVAKVSDETVDYFVISKPCTVMPSERGIGLLQSLFTSDLNKNINLSKQHVMLHNPTVKEIENHYLTTTTGIEPVTAGSIIL